jgi:D-sedoheptulose 7-phosphate isomerase
MTDFVEQYLCESVEAITRLDRSSVRALVETLTAIKERGGRLFVLGSGGSAAHAAHAVNDARKILGLEAYSPSDNIAELTARINDDGWSEAYRDWLAGSRLGPRDGILVFSVGGGSMEPPLSPNLVRALELAKDVGAVTCGIVGRDGGATAQLADVCVMVPTVSAERVTSHTEGLQAVLWHLIVSHPQLQPDVPTWEKWQIANSRRA